MWGDDENAQPTREFVAKQAVRDKQLVTANGTAPIEFTSLTLEMIEFDTPENIEKINKYGNPYA